MENRFLVPVFTPINDDESINYDALQKHVESVIKQGADGIYAGGSSAECWMLTTEQRKKTLEAVIEAANGAFVIAQIGDVGLGLALDLARHAEKAGADMISSVPPFYYGFTFNDCKSYFHALANATSLSMMIYNIPGCTGKLFSADQLTELMADPKIPCMKFTDTDYFCLERLKEKSGKFLYSGSDERFISALAAGADGAIGTTFNFQVGKYLDIWTKFKAGDTEGALKVQKSANRVTEAVIQNGTIAASKFVTSLKGIPMGNAFKPFAELNQDQKKLLTKIAEEEGII